MDLQNPNAKGKKLGKLIIRVESVAESNRKILILFRIYKDEMESKETPEYRFIFDFWDKSDPYLKFLKIRTDNTFIEGGRTEIIKDNLNPNWKPI